MCLHIFLDFIPIYMKYNTRLHETYARKILVTIATIVGEDKKCFKQTSDMFPKMSKGLYFYYYFIFYRFLSLV